MAAILIALPCARAGSQTPLASELVATGFTRPLCVTHAPGDVTRLFVVEKPGRIRIVQGGTILPAPFLDITSIVNSSTLEFGLLSLCFDPDYAVNGFFYVVYTSGTLGDTNLVRFQVTADPDVADPASAHTVMFLAQSTPHHRGSWLGFGADGFLYMSTGDGGPQEDPNNNAQNLALRLGKILRLDVRGDDFPADATRNYRIPPSNPFVGTAGAAPEIWALGLRNPWRCSFDRLTGELWIADVGEFTREEINVQAPSAGGANYGWRCLEGTWCTMYGGCACTDPALTAPVHDYGHSLGRSVTGGYVYRGGAIAGLQGAYLFGDYQSGRIWTMRWSGGAISDLAERTAEIVVEHPASFGEDAAGELYVCDYFLGDLRRIVAGPPPPAPFCAGDGSATPCPCGNAGAPGRGCASSISALGAALAHAGMPILAADTLELVASELSNSTVTFFQGTSEVAGGQGAPFGDGLRCAGGSVIRLGAVAAAGGTARLPEPGGTSISVRGAVTTPGSTRGYQVWYRNAADFCTPATFNLTNGLRVVWR